MDNLASKNPPSHQIIINNWNSFGLCFVNFVLRSLFLGFALSLDGFNFDSPNNFTLKIMENPMQLVAINETKIKS